MSKIFELFGYPLSDTSQEADSCRREARCPFMGSDCDGGGNRHLSNIKLENKEEMQSYFEGRKFVPSGVCSLISEKGKPWIVCPRRLFFLGKPGVRERQHQDIVQNFIMHYSGFPSGTQVGIWPELKLKYSESIDGITKSFDYTFDYIVMPVGYVSAEDVEAATKEKWIKLRRNLELSGYLVKDDGVEDFPIGAPLIIEIMTSSTSGGNKDKRTTIPMAFEDAILRGIHQAPSINYRQVWARMVSQLIVKSEVGLGWGGKTLWILQDTLVDYISTSTALNIHHFLTNYTDEVNIVSFSYGSNITFKLGVIELSDGKLFAGRIAPPEINPEPSFQDMIRSPSRPSIHKLYRLLAKRRPSNKVMI